VDSLGIFTGLNKGEATVVVQFEDLSDTAYVSVQYGESKAVLDSMQTLGNWNMSGIMYDESASAISIVDTPHTIGNGALCLNYQFIRSAESRSYINLNTDISIYGVPDSIFVDVKSDGERHWVNLIVSDDNDELFKASTGQFADVASFYDTLAVATDDLFAILPSSDFHFPIRFKTIEIRLGYNTAVGDTNRGTIYFDNLRVTYPDVMSAIPIYSEDFPRHIQLFQNYPNPFNAQTLIEFATAYAGRVKLSVYDVLGRKVTDLVNRPLPSGVHRVSWESGNLATGVYLYKLETKDATLIRKMILLK
jgi:hypothetical protein